MTSLVLLICRTCYQPVPYLPQLQSQYIMKMIGFFIHKGLKAWERYDTSLSKVVFQALDHLGYVEVKGDLQPLRQKSLVVSPTPVLTFIFAYIILVLLGLRLRRPATKDRLDPDWLKRLVMFHNIFLISLSIYMTTAAAFFGIRDQTRAFSWGTCYDPSQADLANVVYIFYLSKLYEFTDTVWLPCPCIVLMCLILLRCLSSTRIHKTDLDLSSQVLTKI